MVSLLTRVDKHPALEIGLIGIPAALGITDSPVRAVVQATGSGLAHDVRGFPQRAWKV
jgi:hypothetical protein